MDEEEREELLRVVYNLYILIGQASPDAFKNGVTDDFGFSDEGDYYASIFIEDARNILRKYEVKGIG